jgi:predicted membrane-bound spermidine synthase
MPQRSRMHAVNPDDVVVVRHALGRWDVVVVDIADESHWGDCSPRRYSVDGRRLVVIILKLGPGGASIGAAGAGARPRRTS